MEAHRPTLVTMDSGGSTGRSARTRGVVSSAITALATAASVHASQPVYHVDPDAPPGGNGATWNSAFQSLQCALEAAGLQSSSAPIIKVAGGLYTPGHVNALSGVPCELRAFQPLSSVSMLGGFAGFGAADPDQRDLALHPTVLCGDIDGDDDLPGGSLYDNAPHVVIVNSGVNAMLDGFTIRGGFAVAGFSTGGGIHTGSGSQTFLSNCRFERNFASVDGGAIGGEGDVHARNCAFESNRAWRDGGAIRMRAGELEACHFINNSAGSGGAVAVRGIDSSYFGLATKVSGCLFAKNTADTDGAVLALSSAVAELELSTLVANETDGFASVLCQEPSRLAVRGCIFRDNSTGVGLPIAIFAPDPGAAVTVSHSCVQGGRGALLVRDFALDYGWGCFDADPRFVDPSGPDGDPSSVQDNDYRLGPDSPCVDAVPPGIAEGMQDAAGRTRPQNVRCQCASRHDIGAFELPGTDCPPANRTVYVRAAAPPGGDGSSWSAALPTLAEALAAPGVREIWVAAGRYVPPPGGSLSRIGFRLDCNLTIRGGFSGHEASPADRPASGETILSGDLLGNDTMDAATRLDNSSSVVTIPNNSVLLDRVTISGGATGSGGQYQRVGAGISAPEFRAPRIELVDCRITDNHAQEAGGGIAVYGGELRMLRTRIEHNSARSAGGGVATIGVIVSARDCVFANNRVEGSYEPRGGAVWMRLGAQTEYVGCDFVGNVVNGHYGAVGGAVTVEGYSPRSVALVNSRFLGNLVNASAASARDVVSGSAFVALYGDVSTEISNGLFSGNTARGRSVAGGVISSNGALRVAHSTFVNNFAESASVTGPVIRLAHPRVTDSITGCMIWNSGADATIPPIARGSGGSLSATFLSYSIVEHLDSSIPSFASSSLDPLLSNADGPDGRPGTPDDSPTPGFGSPAIDAVPSSLLPLDTADLDNDNNRIEPLPLDLARASRSVDDPRTPNPAGRTTDIGAYEVVCRADLNGDGYAAVGDLFIFLPEWFGRSPAADFNRDGRIGPQDLFDFLVKMLAGC